MEFKKAKLKSALTEQKYFAKMVKGKKGWLVKGLLLGFLAIAGLTVAGENTFATEWQANSVAEISTRIQSGQQELTMIEGDTVWNIGEAINMKNPMELLYSNGFKDGEQYTLAIGTVIKWDGNHAIVEDSSGNVIGDTVVTDAQKRQPDKTFAQQASDTPKNTLTSPTTEIPTESTTSEKTTPVTSETKKPETTQPSEETKKPDTNTDTNTTPDENTSTTTATDLETAKQDLQKAQDQLATTQKDFADFEAARQANVDNLAQQAKDLESQLIDPSDLQAQLNTVTQQITTLQKEVAEGEENGDDVTAKEEELANLQQEVTDLESKIAEVTEKNNEIQATIDEYTAGKEELATRPNEYQEELEKAQQAVDDAQKHIADLTAQLQKEQDEIVAAKTLKEAKDAANAQLLTFPYLLVQQYTDFNSEITNAKSLEELQSILEKVTETNKQEKIVKDAKELSYAISDAIADVNKLKNIDPSLYYDSLNNATTQEEVAQILAQAQEKDAQALAEKELTEQTAKALQTAKDAATAQVNQLQYLPDKENTLQLITNAQSLEEVQQILDAALTGDNIAKDQQDKEDAEKDAAKKLQEAKTTAINKINALGFLTDKQSFVDEVQGAKTMEEIAPIVEKAQQADQKAQQDATEAEKAQALQTAKDTAINQIKAFQFVDPTTYLEKIATAKTVDEVTNLLNQAQQAETTAKAQHEKDLADQKAQEEAAKKLQDAKNTAITEVKALTIDTTDYIKQINAAKTIAEIAPIVEKAKTEDQKAKDEAEKAEAEKEAAAKLQEAKDQAITEVKALTIDTTDYVKQINAAKTIAEITPIVEKAKAEDQKAKDEAEKAKELADAKTTAKAELAKLTYVDQTAYTTQIDSAKSSDEIETILANATKENQEKADQAAKDKETQEILAQQKEAVIKKINALTHLKDKTTYIDQVNNAKTEDEVYAAYDKAVEADKVDANSGVADLLAEARKDEANKELFLSLDAYDVDDAAKYEELQKLNATNLTTTKKLDQLSADFGRYMELSIMDSEEQRDIMKAEFNRLLNEYRTSYGLAEVVQTEAGNWIAEHRSEEAAVYFNHQTPDHQDISVWLEKAADAGVLDVENAEGGYGVAGENILANPSVMYTNGMNSARTVFNQWVASPGHDANLLRSTYNTYGFSNGLNFVETGVNTQDVNGDMGTEYVSGVCFTFYMIDDVDAWNN